MRAAPTDTSLPQTGCAALEVEVVAGESAVTSAFASSPMKLLAPRSRGPSVWAYTSSFGGGLVAGDQTRLDLRIGAGARCFVGTQASTKVYRNPNSRPCGHTTHAHVEPGALLTFAPDPVQAFAGSAYAQRQTFHLASDAGLILVDWFTAGRTACGERWAFSRFRSRNEIFIEGERVFLDALVLDPADGAIDAPHRMGRFNCFALLVMIGGSPGAHAQELLADEAARPVTRRGSLLSSASPVRGGVLLRLAGEQVETVGQELRRRLGFLPALLGDDPLARKW